MKFRLRDAFKLAAVATGAVVLAGAPVALGFVAYAIAHTLTAAFAVAVPAAVGIGGGVRIFSYVRKQQRNSI